ncbi:probable folate-biopterin transporter 4 [Cynara cardunculus var. scolymus]|uniref:probable folate-biopterin transporter 4 n=1 Tax=Cynara cardunculus var. scolymus TaxID=59895 RepID=UPI000D63078E|nr:probable folate-biopterin transporter 4 [Cynara cardunculus var. scolymus]
MIKKLLITFGASFIWLVCFIYFTQGFRSFVWTAVSYQLKDRLKLSPSASQFVTSISFFPWSIKPIYGILSDCIPVKGRKRIPYLVIATLLSLFPWVILGLQESIRNSRHQLMIFLLLQNLGSAMADVVIDAMIAEAARQEKAKFAGDLQSLSWMTMAVGGICGSLFGGYALSNFQMGSIFLLFSVLPTIQLFSCGFVTENPIGSSHLPEFSTSNDTNIHHENVSDEDRSSTDMPKPGTLMRKRSNKSSKKLTSDTSKIPGKDGSLPSQWFQSFKVAGYTLFKAFRRPVILRPMGWFFLSQVTIPNLSTVMFYYQTEVLNLDASFLGTSRVIGWMGLMLGTFTYNRYLKKMKLRKILMFAHVTLSLLTLLDVVLVYRLHVPFGISDEILVLFGSALSDAVHQFKFMPFLILSGQLCPPGIEGTLFALFMSINNFGSTMSSFVGAGLASVLDISSGSFDNLGFGIGIEVICTFIPVAFLFLIPKEATGISA